MEPGSGAEGEAVVPQGSGDSWKGDNHRQVGGTWVGSAGGKVQCPDKDGTNQSHLSQVVSGGMLSLVLSSHLFTVNVRGSIRGSSVGDKGAGISLAWGEGCAVQWVAPVMSS